MKCISIHYIANEKNQVPWNMSPRRIVLFADAADKFNPSEQSSISLSHTKYYFLHTISQSHTEGMNENLGKLTRAQSALE